MERAFSQNKDVDREILQRLDDRDLFQTLLTSKYSYEITNNDDFWRNRIIIKYPSTVPFKPEKLTWKQFYLSTVYYVDKLKKEATFKFLRGDPKYLYNILVTQRKTRIFNDRMKELLNNGYIEEALFLTNRLRRHLSLEPMTMEQFKEIKDKIR